MGTFVGKIIIILSFKVSTSKSKNADHWVNKTCAIRSIQVEYETDNNSLLRDLTMSNALSLFFFKFYYNLKEKDHIRKIINSKNKINIREISIIIILIYQKLESVRSVQQKTKLPLPNSLQLLVYSLSKDEKMQTLVKRF